MKKLPPVSRAWRPIEAHKFLKVNMQNLIRHNIDELIDSITDYRYHADMTYKHFYLLRASLSDEDVTALASLLVSKAKQDLFCAEILEADVLDK